MINKEKVKNVFAQYVENYNANDEKIKLKIEHTYRVSTLCEKIAISENLSSEDIDIAWLSGMLHDIGRFEQIRRYGTFDDAKSIDHALLGIEILFDDNYIRQFVDDNKYDDLLYKAIKYHSAFELPSSLTQRELTFCNILRDADKIDILKVNIDTPIEKIYNVTTQVLKNSVISNEVLADFKQHKTILKSIRQTPVDHICGHIALVFGLCYPLSRQIVKEQGYLLKLLNFKSDNPVTREQFKLLNEVMTEYL